MNFISISSPALNSNGAIVSCVDLRSDLGSSFEPAWRNRASRAFYNDTHVEADNVRIHVRKLGNSQLLRGLSVEQRRNARVDGTGVPEKSRRPAASSGTIATCENLGATPPGIEPSSPKWEASSLTTRPPRPLLRKSVRFVPLLTSRCWEPIWAERNEKGIAPECKGGGNGRSPRENPLTSRRVRHDSHARKSGYRTPSSRCGTATPALHGPGDFALLLPTLLTGLLEAGVYSAD
ncbi:hypothetical protein PR048_026167 [Dryococelus australis]|uniref:Uncharacterized protein n=1 Tax=Dryococelus australis TaxID=614101 RepID=A0ABQ9GKL2_9NEOP|nr:hypothetical protein PR048_026167 [Dryococelus australis]